jgi:hypothetical protein
MEERERKNKEKCEGKHFRWDGNKSVASTMITRNGMMTTTNRCLTAASRMGG